MNQNKNSSIDLKVSLLSFLLSLVQRNVREFNLAEFDELTPADLRALLGALAVNNHFMRLVAKQQTLSKEAIGWLADALSQNRSIEDLVMPSAHIGSSFALIAEALGRNKAAPLLRLEVPDNAIDDKSFAALGSAIGRYFF